MLGDMTPRQTSKKKWGASLALIELQELVWPACPQNLARFPVVLAVYGKITSGNATNPMFA